jgi:hypothetical protein
MTNGGARSNCRSQVARLRLLPALAALAGWLIAGLPAKAEGVPLPALGTDIAATSVSGLSSGAFMASQFHIAHSRIVIGAGIVAGGPYGCAWVGYPGFPSFVPSLWVAGVAVEQCMKGNGMPTPERLARYVRTLADFDRIDPPRRLSSARVYLFHGESDRVVAASGVKAVGELYQRLAVPAASINAVYSAGGHAFLTGAHDDTCGSSRPPFVEGCGRDQAQEILTQIYGALQPKSSQPASELIVFDQAAFTAGMSYHGLDAAGFAYVPPDCRNAPGCRVHVIFHGCSQQRSMLQDRFPKLAGFREWADTNRLVLLFPQVLEEDYINKFGCWDWWGYTNGDFATRDGKQIKAVKRMLDRLSAPPGNH